MNQEELAIYADRAQFVTLNTLGEITNALKTMEDKNDEKSFKTFTSALSKWYGNDREIEKVVLQLRNKRPQDDLHFAEHRGTSLSVFYKLDDNRHYPSVVFNYYVWGRQRKVLDSDSTDTDTTLVRNHSRVTDVIQDRPIHMLVRVAVPRKEREDVLIANCGFEIKTTFVMSNIKLFRTVNEPLHTPLTEVSILPREAFQASYERILRLVNTLNSDLAKAMPDKQP